MPLPAVDRCAVAWLKRKKIPVFFTVHDTNPFNEAPTARGQNIGWKESLRLFNALIVHTNASKKTLERYGVPSEKIMIVPHGLLSFGPIQEAPPSEIKTALFFGTIKPYKGLDILLHAFEEVARGRNVRLSVVGSCQNDDIERYRSLIAKLGIAEKTSLDVRFFNDNEVPALLANATVVVLPYRQIDGSGALLTAIVYERPLIASDIGMFHDILRDDPLALVPPNDAHALARRLAEVLDDPEKLAQLQGGIKSMKSRIPSWDAIGALTLKNYRKYSYGA
jgi:glycosyltransferase involved in cell wall biosynthesis